MPIHDVQCSKCGLIIENFYASPWPARPVHDDGGELQILWRVNHCRPAAVAPNERIVVYQNPATGEISYPPVNDAPMPARYRKRGFERVEFESLRAAEQFEKDNGVCNEKLWYNSGNGV